MHQTTCRGVRPEGGGAVGGKVACAMDISSRSLTSDVVNKILKADVSINVNQGYK